MSLTKRCVAEFFGTFWLVFGGCGSAIFAAAYPTLGIGFVGVAFAFGLTVLTMAFAIGHISGCHLNPAVTLGLVAGKRFPLNEALQYIVAQVVGAITAAGVLLGIANGKPGFSLAGGFASNGYADHSPDHYTMLSLLHRRSGPHSLLPYRHHGVDGQPGTQRLRARGHWPLPDADPTSSAFPSPTLQSTPPAAPARPSSLAVGRLANSGSSGSPQSSVASLAPEATWLSFPKTNTR